jgi:hypothetical protein
MNWTFDYSREASLVRVSLEGGFNLEDHLKSLEELTALEHWKPGINVLFDCRRLDLSETDYEVIKRAADNCIRNDKIAGCGKIALLMKTVADFGRGRQFEMLTDERMDADIRVFLRESDALLWLES